jgi:hypothetical protein
VKFVQFFLALTVATLVCAIAFSVLYMLSSDWYLSRCIMPGHATTLCHPAAWFNAWGWVPFVLAIPGVTAMFLIRRDRQRERI